MNKPYNNSSHLMLLSAILAVFTLCGCRTAKVIERTETERPVVMERTKKDSIVAKRADIARDTIYHHDSIVVRADGVDRWHTRYVTKYKYHTDTITIIKTDSVPRPIMVMQKIEREASDPPNLLSRLSNYVKGCLFGILIAVALFIISMTKK